LGVAATGDEMIMMRNRQTREKLEKDGKEPKMWV